ncbi:MAG: phosphatidate cytidylyltransferase [Oscillospiraceae bacterium]|nr:phosphatidate cytidylyltransferase [Oscillospiraceae bacterium]
MLQRILVAVVGVPFLLAVLVAAPAWATFALLCGLCIIGAHEMMSAVCGTKKARRWWGLPSTTAVFVLTTVFFSDRRFDGSPICGIFPFFAAALLVLTFVVLVTEHGRGEDSLTLQDLCAILLSGTAIPLALSCLLRLRLMEYGGGLVLIPLVSAFCSDTMALFTGMALGKHKLAPLVSPKKTVEGALGGLAGGMIGMVLFRIIFFLCTEVALNIPWCVLLGLIGAAMGQLGDLSFSAVKREFGIKDYGRLLPGHGGVLDRFDSVIFAAPVLWLIIRSIQLWGN